MRGCFSVIEVMFKGEKLLFSPGTVWLLLSINKIEDDGSSVFGVVSFYDGKIHRNQGIIGDFTELEFRKPGLIQFPLLSSDIREGKLVEVLPRIYCLEQHATELAPKYNGEVLDIDESHVFALPADLFDVIAPAVTTTRQSKKREIH